MSHICYLCFKINCDVCKKAEPFLCKHCKKNCKKINRTHVNCFEPKKEKTKRTISEVKKTLNGIDNKLIEKYDKIDMEKRPCEKCYFHISNGRSCEGGMKNRYAYPSECYRDKNLKDDGKYLFEHVSDCIGAIKQNNAMIEILIKKKKKFHCPQCGSLILGEMKQCYNCNKKFMINKMQSHKNNDTWFLLAVMFILPYIIIYLSLMAIFNTDSRGMLIDTNLILPHLEISFFLGLLISPALTISIHRKTGWKQEIMVNVTMKRYIKEIDKIQENNNKINKKIKKLNEKRLECDE